MNLIRASESWSGARKPPPFRPFAFGGDSSESDIQAGCDLQNYIGERKLINSIQCIS